MNFIIIINHNHNLIQTICFICVIILIINDHFGSSESFVVITLSSVILHSSYLNHISIIHQSNQSFGQEVVQSASNSGSQQASQTGRQAASQSINQSLN